MNISGGVLPPPAGLDVNEIATDQGLRAAIKREAEKFREAEKNGRKISHDEIRLIAFLTDEVQRRFDNLSKEEEAELQGIREKAYQRDIERSVDEITSDIESFVDNAMRPHAEIPFSRVNELELRLDIMIDTISRETDIQAMFMDRLKDARARLDDMKKRGIRGFEDLQEPEEDTE